LSDGRSELVIPYADERELLGDILRFGADVVVLGPPRLREQVQAEVRKLAELYGR
jgi:predicted DNA-binding transcriptional regulator YafY